MFEGAVWIRTEALFQESLALGHALRYHLVQETALVPFHAHPFDPERTYCLHECIVAFSFIMGGW